MLGDAGITLYASGQNLKEYMGELTMGVSMSGLQRRLQKLKLRSRAHTLAAQPDGYWKRLLIERLKARSERIQAARDRGEYVPQVEVGEVQQRLRAWLDGREKRA